MNELKKIYENHLKAEIDKTKKQLEDKIKNLEKIENGINNCWEIEFKCPEKKKDTLCPKCTKVLPRIYESCSNGQYANKYEFPPNMSKELQEKVKQNKNGCTEWRKKIFHGACGCGGYVVCKCGYEYHFCLSTNDLETCKYCGRKTTRVSSGIY